jgi:hypothetical protein
MMHDAEVNFNKCSAKLLRIIVRVDEFVIDVECGNGIDSMGARNFVLRRLASFGNRPISNCVI